MHTTFWLDRLNRRGLSEDLGIDRSLILKWLLGNHGFRVYIGFIWLRIGTGDEFYKMRGISLLEELSVTLHFGNKM
jgi:hypothetical protein